jgi:hypothetical protein
MLTAAKRSAKAVVAKSALPGAIRVGNLAVLSATAPQLAQIALRETGRRISPPPYQVKASDGDRTLVAVRGQRHHPKSFPHALGLHREIRKTRTRENACKQPVSPATYKVMTVRGAQKRDEFFVTLL